MSKLTSADLAAVRTFFASPSPLALAPGLAAQSYEPRGSGYDPSTDTRLAHLVLHGVRPGKSAWARAACIVDQLCGRPGGAAHLEVLRLACDGRAQVGGRTARAMAYGRELAIDAARMSELEAEHRDCAHRGLTGIQAAMRILDLEVELRARAIEVSVAAVRMHALDAVRRRLVDVDVEVDALIDAAADALHVARAKVDAVESAAVAREAKRCADLRAELAGKRAAKERARFERRLRDAS